jgi:hypothetical protein
VLFPNFAFQQLPAKQFQTVSNKVMDNETLK